jgi:beta-lactam-binding protein with PASTA domain
LSQEPAARRRVAVETDVDLVVATPVTVLVPDLVGLDETTVAALLQETELTRGTVDREESRQTAGTVLTQAPPAGTRVIITTPVAFAVAAPVTVVMPDVSGLTEAAALDLLDQYELGLGVLANRESPIDIGRVLEQWPTVGTRVDIGTGVDLVVAAVETVEIPTVVGMSVDATRQVLTSLRLSIGDETREASRTEDEGTVLGQHPPASTRVAVGSVVNVVVAEPDMVVIPTIVGLLNSEVEQALEAAGLVAGLVEPRFSLEPGGIVLSQGHPAGGLLEFGTPMAFSVARDRILWAGPLLGVVAFVVVGLVVRRLRAGSTPQPSTGPATDLAPAPAVPIRTERDPDRQTTPPDAQPETTLTVRWKPTVDGGTQTLEVDGDLHNFGRLIANDRRQP